MNWEEKLQALNALSECKLIMRKPGDWYVSQAVEVKDGGILRGEYGNGTGPAEAVIDHWQRLTDLKSGLYLVGRTFGTSSQRLAVRWNGFMWDRVEEDAPSSLPLAEA